MNVVVTGKIGIGKTTVCKKTLNILKSKGCSCGGIISYKSLDGSIKVLDVKSGKERILAIPNLPSSKNIFRGPHIGKFLFNCEGLKFGVEAIEKGISSDFLFVDEVGYLELQGEGFSKVFGYIKEKKVKNCILVIRSSLVSLFLTRLEFKALIIEINIENRDKIPEDICKLLGVNC